jgi:hypothetical protein
MYPLNCSRFNLTLIIFTADIPCRLSNDRVSFFTFLGEIIFTRPITQMVSSTPPSHHIYCRSVPYVSPMEFIAGVKKMVIPIYGWALLDTGVCLLQHTTSSGAKMAVFIFPQQSPIYGWALANINAMGLLICMIRRTH